MLAPSRLLALLMVVLALGGCANRTLGRVAYPPQAANAYPYGGIPGPAYGSGEDPGVAAPLPRLAPDATQSVEGAPLAPLDTPPPAPAASSVAPGKIPVAVLLPLSGANAALGRAFLDAAQLALFDLGDKNLALLPRDTASTPEGAAQAAASAVTEGARLIIGPIVGAEVAAVKPVAQAAHVSVIAFSTATQYAGDGVWLMGFLPQQEVQRVVAYAAEQGIGRFAGLVPGNAYGELVGDALRSAVAQVNGTVDRVQRYDTGSTDVSGPVQALAAAGSFGALLLPDGGPRLRTVAAQLGPGGVDPARVKILGSGQWDEPGLGQEPSLVGGWYAAPAPDARASFEQHYQSVYHRKPPRLATLAYDATGIAAVLARSPGADFGTAALANPSGFAGADGVFRLLPDGTNQRALAVLEVTPTGTRIVSPAVETFSGVGQ